MTGSGRRAKAADNSRRRHSLKWLELDRCFLRCRRVRLRGPIPSTFRVSSSGHRSSAVSAKLVASLPVGARSPPKDITHATSKPKLHRLISVDDRSANCILDG